LHLGNGGDHPVPEEAAAAATSTSRHSGDDGTGTDLNGKDEEVVSTATMQSGRHHPVSCSEKEALFPLPVTSLADVIEESFSSSDSDVIESSTTHLMPPPLVNFDASSAGESKLEDDDDDSASSLMGEEKEEKGVGGHTGDSPSSYSRHLHVDSPFPSNSSQDEYEVEEEIEDEIEDEEEEGKMCWVCFASEEDDPHAMWTHPCRCSGTTKWVHQACIQRWVDEKQKGNLSAQVCCPQCNVAYRIMYPSRGLMVVTLDSLEKLTQRISPIMFGGLCVGSLYWSCITFGAVTLMQTVGQEKGQVIIERADPLFLIVSLPLVPVGLVLSRMIRWEEPVLKTLRRVVPKVPILRNLLPAFNYVPDANRPNLTQHGGAGGPHSTIPPITNPVCVTRTICSGLMFPSAAVFLGWALFSGSGGPSLEESSQLKRSLLGGATCLLIEGALTVYHKQHTYIRHCEREILDYQEELS